MWRSVLKVTAATAAFGLVHSLFASHAAKGTARTLLGERSRNGLYRVFFIGQSLVTFAALAAYIRRQPGRELYRIEGPLAAGMHAAEAAALVYGLAAARQIGLRRVSGIESFLCWLGDGPVPAEPEAQGPALDAEGTQRGLGPFTWSRHPLNFAAVPIFWLWPRMTTNLLAFNTAATIYLVVGSRLEEVRLRRVFKDDYVTYQQSGVSFFLPRPPREQDAKWSTLQLSPARPGEVRGVLGEVR